jgi:hypothetical protein
VLLSVGYLVIDAVRHRGDEPELPFAEITESEPDYVPEDD